MRPRAAWRAACAVALAGLLGACASTPLQPLLAFPDREPFEQALLAYAQGQTDSAAQTLQQTDGATAGDARAQDLLAAVRAESEHRRLPPLGELAADTGPAPTTPAAVLATVKARNLDLRAAVYRVIEARARLREAKVSMSPELSLMTRFYPLGILAGLTQSVYGGLVERKAMISDAESELLAALANYATTRRAVLADALEQYHRLQAGEAQAGALAEELAAADNFRVQMKTLALGGNVLRTRVFEAQAEIASAQSSAEAVTQQVMLARSRLNALMQRPVEAALPLAAQAPVAMVPDDPQAAARQGRQELASARAAVLKATAVRARTDTLTPDISLRTAWGQSDGKNERSIDRGFTISALFKVPVLVVPLRRARLDRAEALVAQAALAEEDAFQQIALDVIDAQGGLASARKAAEASERRALVAEDQLKVRALRTDALVEELDPDELLVREARDQLRALRSRREALIAHYAVERANLQLALASAVDPGAIPFESRAPLARLSSAGGAGRALWVWRSSFIGQPDAVRELLDWASASGLDHLFVALKASQLTTERAALVAFIEQAHARGVKIHALAGDPAWVRPGKQDNALRYLETVLAFNRDASDTGRLDALHLDIEPQALRDWDDSDAQEDLLEGLVAVVQKLAKAADGQIPLYADLPVWLAKRDGVEPPVLPKLARALSGVVFMAYGADRERLDAQLRKAGQQIAATGRPWWIGVSAAASDRCPDETPEQFENALRKLTTDLSETGPVLGVAIHDLDRYRALILDKAPGTAACRSSADSANSRDNAP